MNFSVPFSLVFTLIFKGACSAQATVITFSEIVSSKLMAFFAVCLSSVDSSRALTTQDILFECNNLKMVWIYTLSNSAQMIKVSTFWDRFHKKPISKSVSKLKLAFTIIKYAVPTSINMGRPQPAGTGLVYFIQESFHERFYIMGCLHFKGVVL